MVRWVCARLKKASTSLNIKIYIEVCIKKLCELQKQKLSFCLVIKEILNSFEKFSSEKLNHQQVKTENVDS